MKKYIVIILLSFIIGWLFRQSVGVIRTLDDNSDISSRKELSLKKSHSPAAIITNILEPTNTWIRLEISYLFDSSLSQAELEKTSDVLVQDTITFLRTLKLKSLEGPLGLIHLREDLQERANLRMQGKHIELYIKTMVVQ